MLRSAAGLAHAAARGAPGPAPAAGLLGRIAAAAAPCAWGGAARAATAAPRSAAAAATRRVGVGGPGGGAPTCWAVVAARQSAPGECAAAAWARRAAGAPGAACGLPAPLRRRLHELVGRGFSSAAAGADEGAPAPEKPLREASAAAILHKAPHHDFPRARAVKTRFKTSLKKLNLVCKLVRRARVDAALMQLALSPKVPLPPLCPRPHRCARRLAAPAAA